MSADGVAVLAIVAIGLLVSLALYAMVRAEHGQREVMDREAAERRARQDLDERERGRRR